MRPLSSRGQSCEHHIKKSISLQFVICGVLHYLGLQTKNYSRSLKWTYGDSLFRQPFFKGTWTSQHLNSSRPALNCSTQFQEQKSVFYKNKDKLSISCKLQLFGYIHISPISPPIYIYIFISHQPAYICTYTHIYIYIYIFINIFYP